MTSAAIFDIDGVLSDSWHRRSYIRGSKPDWPAFFDACETDPPLPLCSLTHTLGGIGWRLFYVTTRPESNRDKTEAWLDTYCAPGTVYMRPEASDSDHRGIGWKVNVIRDLCDRFEVKFIFEDSPDIIVALKRLKLPVVGILSGYYSWTVGL
jgi:hypothetical protein